MKKIIGIGLIGLGIYWIYKCHIQKKQVAFSTNPNNYQATTSS
jgi:hypothetical protein